MVKKCLFVTMILMIGLVLGVFIHSWYVHWYEVHPPQQPGEEPPQAEELALTYQKWEYEGIFDHCRDDTNLTSHTQSSDIGKGFYGTARGWFLISSWEEYQDYMEIISKKLTEEPAP